MSAAEAEALLRNIVVSTAVAEKEKAHVTGIVQRVSAQAEVRSCLPQFFFLKSYGEAVDPHMLPPSPTSHRAACRVY